MPAGLDALKHLVVLMLENRSYDHMLGFAQTDNWRINGLDGPESNTDSTGEAVRVSSDAGYGGDLSDDPGHSLRDSLMQLYGDPNTSVAQEPTMTGFITSYEGKSGNPARAHRIMRCFSPSKLPVLVNLAQQFAVCTSWFSSLPGPTFPNRAFAHAATSIGRVDMGPIWWGMPKTIYELLVENGRDARIYYHDSTMAMTFKSLMNEGRCFSEIDDFFADCKNDRLPQYSFIEPRYANSQDDDTGTYYSASDQHPDHNVEQGEILTQQVFNAVWNKSIKVRNSTLLVIVYDEHGGLFDHVHPPITVNPDGKRWAGGEPSEDPPFDFTRLGVRVPAVLVSPYIPPRTIDGTLYDHASLIATARKLFLPDRPDAFLTERDRQAHTFERNLTLGEPRNEPIQLTPASLAQSISDHIRAHVQVAAFLEEQAVPPALRTGINPATITTQKAASDYLQQVKAKMRALQAPADR